MENRGFEALEAPPKRRKRMNLHNVLLIDKHMCATRSGVRLIVGGAIDRSSACIRLSALCSISRPCQLHVRSIVGIALDRTAFDRTRWQITASKLSRHKS